MPRCESSPLARTSANLLVWWVDLIPGPAVWLRGQIRDFRPPYRGENRHFRGCEPAHAGNTVSSMGSDRYGEVQALARDVQGLLRRLDPKSLQLKPNSYEPTVGESL